MFRKCFLINQVQITIPMIPMFLCSCARKKIDDEENDMVVEPMACDDGNIFDILTLEISVRYTL